MQHIWTGPQSAKGRNFGGSKTASKPSISEIYKVNEVTPDMIAYACTIVSFDSSQFLLIALTDSMDLVSKGRFTISQQSDWSRSDGIFDNKKFYDIVYRLLTRNQSFCNQITGYYTKYNLWPYSPFRLDEPADNHLHSYIFGALSSVDADNEGPDTMFGNIMAALDREESPAPNEAPSRGRRLAPAHQVQVGLSSPRFPAVHARRSSPRTSEQGGQYSGMYNGLISVLSSTLH